ncbi:hypothetical protein CEXT_608631 [Caerostris extrusa]|uniref:Uncharacterized protein n=1 Tax=Caerostris extrusa TaxID=172846 RepID=A0AAV4R1W3_CAEEX|nr:hypothetical protein CEXT_608631 [Caerostris extrusa]
MILNRLLHFILITLFNRIVCSNANLGRRILFRGQILSSWYKARALPNMIIGLGEGGGGVNEKEITTLFYSPLNMPHKKAAHRLLFSSPEEANEPLHIRTVHFFGNRYVRVSIYFRMLIVHFV